jgi:hypothetical protein
MAIGTPSYMAPEQLAGDPTADHRIDLYAVGLLAYELLTGESPFAGPSPRETMAAQLTRDPTPLHEANPSVPPALSSLVMRLLSKDPDGRPQTAESVLEELDAMTTVGMTPPRPVTPASGVIATQARRLTGVFAAIGVLAVLLIVTFFVMRPNATVRAQRQAARRDSIRRADSQRVALAAPPPLVLSHQDSVAIAEKVNRQLRQARVRDSVARARLQDSLQKVEEKKARDSLFKAFGGRAAPVKRRVVVVEPIANTRWPQAEQIGRAVGDSLRAMLARRAYIVVNSDSVRLLRVQPEYRTPAVLASALNSELLVSIRIFDKPVPRGSNAPDSAMLSISAYDLTAKSGYNQRSFPLGPAWVAREEILSNLESTLLQTVGAIDEMSRAPRKTADDATDTKVFRFPGRAGAIDIRMPGAIVPPKKPPIDSTRRPPP